MPFVTEELNSIYKKGQELLVTSSWPILVSSDTVQSKSIIDFLIGVITEIRSIRSELRVAPSIKIKLIVLNDGNDLSDALVEIISKSKEWQDYLILSMLI